MIYLPIPLLTTHPHPIRPSVHTTAGMTVAPSQATPYVEVVSFRDCAAAKAQAEQPPTGFELVPIEAVQPPDAQESLIAEPDAEAVSAKDEEEEYYSRRGESGFGLGGGVWSGVEGLTRVLLKYVTHSAGGGPHPRGEVRHLHARQRPAGPLHRVRPPLGR